MPSPEGGPRPGDPEEPPQHDQQPPLYQRAARFAGEQPAGQAYFAAQRVIYEAAEPTDISVFRLQLNRLWYVAALGLVPPVPVLTTIERVLDTGEPADLPPPVWDTLRERRRQARQLGPWVERHRRPDPPR